VTDSGVTDSGVTDSGVTDSGVTDRVNMPPACSSTICLAAGYGLQMLGGHLHVVVWW
jgi:hypothetical protein